MIPRSVVIDHEYHVVELHRYSLEAIDWCVEMFGSQGSRWFTNSANHNKIYFANSKDHLMFILRWS